MFRPRSQKRTHERSQKHKDAIERKMKDIANKTAKKKSDEDSLKRQIQEIENQAMQAFAEKDVGGAKRTDRWAITNERECKENIKEKL